MMVNLLSSPVSLPSVTHSRVFEVEFNFVTNQVRAQVEFGYLDSGAFVKLAERTIEWSQSEVVSRLSSGELSALGSLKNRILNAAEARL